MFATCILIHVANWPRVLKYTWPTVQLVSTGFTTCIYVATCTWPTVRHVYSDRTRGELQVAKIFFFFVVKLKIEKYFYKKVQKLLHYSGSTRPEPLVVADSLENGSSQISFEQASIEILVFFFPYNPTLVRTTYDSV
jgi:hypothetical protein